MHDKFKVIEISRMILLVGLMLLISFLTVNRLAQAKISNTSVDVMITENGFDPSVITIDIGTTVIWTNKTQQTLHLKSGEPHRLYLPLILGNVSSTKAHLPRPQEIEIVAVQSKNNWVDHDLAAGQSYSYTFTTIGDFPLFVKNQPGKIGLIKVIEPVPDFTINISPNPQTIGQGQSAVFSVALTETQGFTSPVMLSVSGLPTSATSAWSNNPVTPPDSTVLTITSTIDTLTGTYNLAVSGNGGGQSYNSQVSLIVEPPPPSPLFETVLSVLTETGYANTPDNTSLDLGRNDGEDFTIETFFYVSDLSYDPPFADMLTQKDKSYKLFVSFNSGQSDAILFTLWTAAGAEVTLTYFVDLSLGWHHVAAIYDNEFTGNEDLMAIYLDGNLGASSIDANIHVDWTPGIPNSSNELVVGGVPFGSAGFNDLIEEMRFSDIVRYGGASYTVPTNPFSSDANTRALWHFDEPAGSTIFSDDSNNNNTLTGQEAQTYHP